MESHLDCENRKKGETGRRYGAVEPGVESHLNCGNGKKGETGRRCGAVMASAGRGHC